MQPGCTHGNPLTKLKRAELEGQGTANDVATRYENLRSEALKPIAGDPAGQELNSQGSVNGCGVVDIDPVPDWSCVGADRTTCRTKLEDQRYRDNNMPVMPMMVD